MLTSLIGTLYLGPQGGKFARLAQERGIDYPEVMAARDRHILVQRIDYAALVPIGVDMVFKPGRVGGRFISGCFAGLMPLIPRSRYPWSWDRSELQGASGAIVSFAIASSTAS